MNNNNSILLVDQQFDPNAITNRNLLFKITADSFSYALLNTDAGRLEVLYDQQDCDAAAALADRIQTDPYLSLAFNQIKAAVWSANTLTVPEVFYQQDAAQVFANYFHETVNYSDTLYTNAHEDYDFKTVFLLPKQIDQALNNDGFAALEKYGQTAALLAMLKPAEADQLILDFTGNSFYALLFQAGKLVFQNSYAIEDDEEFTYYLLLIMQQLGLDPAQTRLMATGIINPGDSRYALLETYFPVLNILEPESEQINLTLLEDMPIHYYTSLLAINLCA